MSSTTGAGAGEIGSGCGLREGVCMEGVAQWVQWGSHGGPAINTSDGAKHAECVLSSVALPTANLLISWWRRGARARRS